MIPLGSPGFARRIAGGLGPGHNDPTFFQTILFWAVGKVAVYHPVRFSEKTAFGTIQVPKVLVPNGPAFGSRPRMALMAMAINAEFFRTPQTWRNHAENKQIFPQKKNQVLNYF
jgi:hypothetical protein